ncbi:MAG TPA: hypothetical protein VH134_12935 [Candidatus Dormibacteraeota bacterium]|nr:hypothetical protein [Candidatus Dormibacteraeota bacterium]
MARGVVALAVPVSLLTIAIAGSGVHARAAVTAPPPPAAAPVAQAVPDSGGVSAWSTAPVAAGAAERSVLAHNPTGLNPQPQARQGSSEPPPEETRFGSGEGVNLDPLGTCISCTNASAGRNSSASESKELKVADESLSEGQGPSNGYNGGSTFVVPSNPLLSLALGTFQMDNRADNASSEAHSHGTLANLQLADGQVATLVIFESRSNASYSSTGGSRRDGSSSALYLAGGSTTLTVLHSDSQSRSQGHVYLVQVNDREIATAEQVGGNQPLNVPKVLSVSLFRAGPDGAVVGGVQDGSSNEFVGIVASSANSPGDQH